MQNNNLSKIKNSNSISVKYRISNQAEEKKARMHKNHTQLAFGSEE